MLKSRRLRTLVLLLGVLGLLVGPSVTPAHAQVPDTNMVALVTGRTDPPPDPEGHALALNRVSGPSAFRDDFLILATIQCNGTTAVVPLATADPVTFSSDDDITDGTGTVDDAHFEGPNLVGGATVEVDITDGDFHRLGAVVEVFLTVDITIGGTPCPGPVGVRITFHLLADVQGLNPANPLEGFLLAGVATRNGVVAGDDTSVARTVCGALAGVTPSTEVPPPNPQGRGPLHPCN